MHNAEPSERGCDQFPIAQVGPYHDRWPVSVAKGQVRIADDDLEPLVSLIIENVVQVWVFT